MISMNTGQYLRGCNFWFANSDLKRILIACETDYSELIQVHQLRNQKLRYGQYSNDFRRLQVMNKVADLIF